MAGVTHVDAVGGAVPQHVDEVLQEPLHLHLYLLCGWGGVELNYWIKVCTRAYEKINMHMYIYK